METPAHPIARVLAIALCLFLVIGLSWTWFGHVDIVASAQGKLVPTGRVKVIQPRDIGVIRNIYVEDGQQVRAGDMLIELDPTENAADWEQLANDLYIRELQTARLMALLQQPDDPLAAFDPPRAPVLTTVPGPGAETPQLAVQRRLMLSQAEEYAGRIGQLATELDQRTAQRQSIAATVQRLTRTLPVISERVATYRTLSEKGWTPRTQYLELEQERLDIEGELAAQQHRLREADAAIASLADEERQAVEALRAQWLADLADAESAANNIRQEMVKADNRRGLQRLVSPIDGVVTQLAVHTVGGVVTGAQPLMTIVPRGDRLEVEAMVLNKDVGFIEEGQTAAIKLETFPFTKYGIIDGEITTVSRDAITVDNAGLLYPARVTMAQTDMLVDGRAVPLDAGMSATVEVKIGQRRLMEFILAPIFRYKDESLRER